MKNEMNLGTIETTEILNTLAKRGKVTFDDLTREEKIALNQKEIIEDDFFIMLNHRQRDVNKTIDELCPLNFYVNEDYDLVIYCEDKPTWERVLPADTKLKFNRI